MITLSSRYENEFREMLRNTVNWPDRKSTKLTAFWPLSGSLYEKGGLMVVGRAVNGWGEDFERGQMADETIVDRILRDAKKDEGTPEPMHWIDDYLAERVIPNPGEKVYRFRSSAFWQLVKNICGLLHPNSDNDNTWWSRVAWSNLDKVSPYSGGNPSESLRRHQLSQGKKLLKMEIEEFRPSIVVFITDSSWYDRFSDDDGIAWKEPVNPSFVQRIGKYEKQAFMITQRPEFKSHKTVFDQTAATLKELGVEVIS